MDGDLELLKRFVELDDRGAFSALVTAHADALFTTALRVTNNAADAEDIVQEACLKAMHAAPGFRGETAVKHWLVKITMNLALNRRRDNARARDRLKHLATAAAPNPENEDRARALLEEAVAELEPDMQEVVILYHYQRMTQQEIAATVGCSQKTVSQRLQRSQEELEAWFRNAGFAVLVPLAVMCLGKAQLAKAPATLVAALQGLAGLAAQGAVAGTAATVSGQAALAAAGTIGGGILVTTKTFILSSVLIAGVCMGAGFLGHQALIESQSAFDAESSDASGGLAELRDEFDAYKTQAETSINTLRKENERLAASSTGDADLAALRSELREKEAQLAERELEIVRLKEREAQASASGVKKPSRKFEDIRADLESAIADKNGKKAAAYLTELAALGEDYYPQVLSNWNTLVSGQNGTDFGLGQTDLIKHLSDINDVLEWGLKHKDQPMLMRLAGAQMLPLKDTELALAVFSEVVQWETNDAILRTMLVQQSIAGETDYPDNLANAVLREDIPGYARAGLAILISKTHGPEGDLAFRRLEQSTEKDLVELLPLLRIIRQPQATGLLIFDLSENSSLYKEGLRGGDIVTELNNTPITGHNGYYAAATNAKAGDPFRLTLYRDGASLHLDLTQYLAERGHKNLSELDVHWVERR